MAIFIPWLADAARLPGYPVVEVAGWRTRGHGGMRVVEGVVAHHTAGPSTGNYPSLNVVTYGRTGLAGPLSQLGLGRDGTVYVIAAGLSYHAGASAWAGFTDLNDEFIGIEAESTGTHDDWTVAQRDCYPRLIASLLYYMKRSASRSADHKEVALPLGRKPDRAFWNSEASRQTVAYMLADPLNRIPRFANPPEEEIVTEEEMRKVAQLAAQYVMNYPLPQGGTLDKPDGPNYAFWSWVRNGRHVVDRTEVKVDALAGQLTQTEVDILAAYRNAANGDGDMTDEQVQRLLDRMPQQVVLGLQRFFLAAANPSVDNPTEADPL